MPKPFDQSFKLLADDDPRSAMAIFAGIPLDADLEVRAADRELNLPALQVDHLYRCKQAGEEFLIHFEAVSRFRPAILDRQVQTAVPKLHPPADRERRSQTIAASPGMPLR